MRNTFKNGLSVLLALVLVVGSVAVGGEGLNGLVVKASALESTGNATFDAFINDSRWKDGTWWGSRSPEISPYDCSQCCAYAADFVKYCFGYDSPRSGEYFTGATNIRAGDVLLVGNGGNGYGHWFVCLKRSENSLYVAEGNCDEHVRIGWNYTIVNDSTISGADYSFSCGWHYSSGTPDPANLGDDFYGIILNSDCWRPIESDSETGKVYLQKEDGNPRQKWHFVRREGDNAYTIASCYDGKLLEMTDGIRTAGTQIQAHGSYWGGNYQKWYLIPYGNGYIIKSKHFADENWVMDLKGANPTYGNIIEIWELNYTPAQVWNIYIGDEVQLKAATLSASVNSSTATFTWNEVWGARYDLKIWKSGETQGDPYTVLSDTASGCTVELPPGTYVCSVDSWDYYQRFTSNQVTVSVSDPSKPTASITSYTEDVAPSQTVTLSLRDDEALAGYYWGTSSTYENNPFTPVSGTSQTVTETVSAPGTYYLTAKDAKGKVSSTVSKKFYQTTLDAVGGTVSPESVLLVYTVSLWFSRTDFDLPTPTRSGYIFQNWNTKADGSGTAYAAGESFTVTGNSTLYAQWEPAPHVHEYISAVTQEPTCTEEGVRTYTCECGDSYTETIEKAPHTLSDWIVLRQPSCTVTGLRVKMCTVCLQTIESETIPALEHSYGEWTVITAPTCTEPGEGSHTCANCGAEETAAIPALGHDYAETVTPPTCTQDGFTAHVCSRCHDTYTTDVVPATGHTYSEWMMLVDPTLTADGVMGRKCTVCGAVLDEVTVPRLAGDHVTGVALSAARVYMNRGETLTLTAAVTPDTAHNKALAWSSSHPETATVTNGAVTAVAPGLALIIAQAEDSGHKDFCVVQVNAVTPQNGAVIENGTITGLRANLNSMEDYLNLLDESMTIETSGTIGTGTKVYIMQGDTVVNEFETVLFGDIDGDGWYDGTDAYFVKLAAMGMIPATALTEAQRMAADCNHDGTVDNADVALLEQAGLLLVNVDQTLPSEELQTDSVYLEYCSLIDQTVEIIEPDQPAVDQPAQTAKQPAAPSVWGWIKTLFTIVLNWLLRVF